ncbi:MAG: phosphate transporter, ATPase subunit, partial [Gemmatimonadales bacterium]|nr:phosphate transporter, ATPase subunit [Gemmatimonadales bacterium]
MTAALAQPAAPDVTRQLGTIEARNFSFWYGKKQALKNINIAVPPRAVTALIGPSGCGKSTFLRSINRLNDLIPGIRHEGEMCLDGQSIFDKGVDVVAIRQRVGMVFQRWNPFPRSIYENVAYGPRINGVDTQESLDEIVERSLRRAALWDEVKDRLRTSALGL